MNVGPESIVKLRTTADQGSAETIAGRIGLVQGSVEIRHADHLQDRAEQLHVGPLLNCRNVDDGW